eukprot:scaffold89045_cov32-Tisochrysis_lutea.AAC.4
MAKRIGIIARKTTGLAWRKLCLYPLEKACSMPSGQSIHSHPAANVLFRTLTMNSRKTSQGLGKKRAPHEHGSGCRKRWGRGRNSAGTSLSVYARGAAVKVGELASLRGESRHHARSDQDARKDGGSSLHLASGGA